MSSEANLARPGLRYRAGYTPPPQRRVHPKSTHHLPSQQQLDPKIEDDFGTEIPIRAAELDVLETYLNHLFDRLFTSVTDQSSQSKGDISC